MAVDYKYINVKLVDLFLDPNNPRFNRREYISYSDTMSEKIQLGCKNQINNVLKEDLTALKKSISEIGYVPVNSIVVKLIPGQNDKYYVVEGNCRLLIMKELMQEIMEEGKKVKEKVYNSIKEVQVLLYDGNDDNFAYEVQGACHLINKKDWSPFAQARFLVNKMDTDKLESPAAAGKIFGLSARKSNELARAYYSFIQLEEDSEYGDDVSTDQFSFFIEALNSANLKKWLEHSDKTMKDGFLNTENRRIFYSWFIGDENNYKRINHSIMLRKVAKLLTKGREDLFNRFIETGKDNDSIESLIQEIDEESGNVDWEKVKAKLKKQLRIINKVNFEMMDNYPIEVAKELTKIKDKCNSILDIIVPEEDEL